jgi:hypothetical protein
MTEGEFKETTPKVLQSLEKLGLSSLVSRLIIFSEFITDLDVSTSKKQGYWKIEHWISRDEIPTMLISNEDKRLAFEVGIIGEQDSKQLRKITHIEIGKGRTEIEEISVDTSKLLDPRVILSSDQNPSDQQL